MRCSRWRTKRATTHMPTRRAPDPPNANSSAHFTPSRVPVRAVSGSGASANLERRQSELGGPQFAVGVKPLDAVGLPVQPLGHAGQLVGQGLRKRLVDA